MKIRENRMYVVWICMAGFLAGILYANVLAADEIAGIGIFQEYFLGRFSGVEILSADYIWRLLVPQSSGKLLRLYFWPGQAFPWGLS